MEREQVVAALRAHEAELRASGVVGVSLFGSVARRESPAHDVDVAVRLGAGFCRPGFDYFRGMEVLERRLSAILACRVDVVEEPARKQRLQQEIDRDRARAF